MLFPFLPLYTNPRSKHDLAGIAGVTHKYREGIGTYRMGQGKEQGASVVRAWRKMRQSASLPRPVAKANRQGRGQEGGAGTSPIRSELRRHAVGGRAAVAGLPAVLGGRRQRQVRVEVQVRVGRLLLLLGLLLLALPRLLQRSTAGTRSAGPCSAAGRVMQARPRDLLTSSLAATQS